MNKGIDIIVLGSCVSRITMLNGDQSAHDIADENLHLSYFLDKQNIALQMMPRPFSEEEVNSITSAQLWDTSRIHTVHQALNKETVDLILNSSAQYIVMDLFDFQTNFGAIGNTAFDLNAYEFMNTDLFKKYKNQIEIYNFMTLPKWCYYPYVDLFFEKIMQKYDSNHIILNRFRANTYYLAKDGYIKTIPPEFKNPYQANDLYNNQLFELEQYVIDKYNPYVIDLSKFYMGDENKWSNLQGAHFENDFYLESFKYVRDIIFNKPEKKYLSAPSFFTANHSPNKLVGIDETYTLMLDLLDKNDLLWINILEKLFVTCPDEPVIKEYVELYLNEIQKTPGA